MKRNDFRLFAAILCLIFVMMSALPVKASPIISLTDQHLSVSSTLIDDFGMDVYNHIDEALLFFKRVKSIH